MPDADGITRRCYACKIFKPIDEFSKDKKKIYGRSYCCKHCTNERSRKWAKQNTETVREYARKYIENNREKLRNKHHNPHSRAIRSMRSKQQRILAPQKCKVRDALNAAVRYGKISKPNRCEQCRQFSSRIQAHHHNGYDWEHRFDVRWLCSICHGLTHRI